MSSSNDSTAVQSPYANLLLSLTRAPATGTLSARLPWQYSFEETGPDAKFFIKTWTLDEIPGLLLQTRGSLVQHVSGLKCQIRKIPGIDITYRFFVAALSDFEDVTKIGDVSSYIATYPTARTQYTLSTATTDNTIEFDVEWPIGVGTSVTYNMPPVRTPLLFMHISGNAKLASKVITATISGTIEIDGIGHVAGTVPASGVP